MTTWAYKSGMLVADRAICSEAGTWYGAAAKIAKANIDWFGDERECLLATAGHTGFCQQMIQRFLMDDGFARYVKFERIEEDVPYEFALFLEGDFYYRVCTDDHGYWSRVELERGYEAGGSGRKYALGAMAVGAPSIEAVRIASKFDNATGFNVDALKCDWSMQ